MMQSDTDSVQSSQQNSLYSPTKIEGNLKATKGEPGSFRIADLSQGDTIADLNTSWKRDEKDKEEQELIESIREQYQNEQAATWNAQYSSGNSINRIGGGNNNSLLGLDGFKYWNPTMPAKDNRSDSGGYTARGPLDQHVIPPHSSSVFPPENSITTTLSYEQRLLQTSPEKDLPSYATLPRATMDPHSSLLRQYQSYTDQPTFILPDSTPEYSIFVGDLSHDLSEEDLVAQFLQPSPWPATHPFAIAHAQAQQSKGFYGSMTRFRPAPFLSTKSAKIMKDPITGMSRGFGFVRFSREEDCARALVEMQGMIIHPVGGQGRPLRVCTATPKNREVTPPSLPSLSTSEDSLNLYHQLQLNQHRMSLPTTISSTSSSPPRDSNYGSIAPSAALPLSLSNALFGKDGKEEISNNTTSQNSSALDPSNTTVFVGGLSSLISEETLKTFFAPFGEIIYVKIPPGKGCGFVQFVRKIDAERAIERMQGFPIGGGRIRLSWGRSQGDKAAAAAAQAVAQSAQINHLANLAGLGVLTPTQISQLAGASIAANAATAAAAAAVTSNTPASPTTTDANTILRQLAAAISNNSATAHAREKSSTLDNLPIMEQQHRQAQQQLQARQMSYPSSDQWEYNQGYSGRLAPSPPRMTASRWNEGLGRDQSEDYLSSLLPSLNLGGEVKDRMHLVNALSPKGQPMPSFSSGLAALNNEVRQDVSTPTPSKMLNVGNEMMAMKQSSMFSPFSPPVSPGLSDAKNLTRQDSPLSFRDQILNASKETSFSKYIDAQQQRQQDQYQHLSNHGQQ